MQISLKEDLEQLIAEQSVQKIHLSSQIETKQELLDQYRAQTGAEYMGTSWDSLIDVLHDSNWTKSERVYVVHDSLPRLDDKDLALYLKILIDAERLHATGPRENFTLPQKRIDFHVVFLAKDKNDLVELETAVNSIINN